MPLDFGVSSLVIAEWSRFTRAVKDLSDGGEERAIQAAARRGGGAPAETTVLGPADYARAAATAAAFSGALGGAGVIGTADFHIRPAPQVTKADYAAHFGALARGDPSPLSPELQAAIAARIDRAQEMAASPSPEWAQAAGQALTALDNVQDLMTALAVFGRLTLPALGPLARVAGPFVGGVMIAGDVLRLLTKFGMLAIPGYAIVCGAPAGAVAAGVPAILFGRVGKKAVTGMGTLNPFARGRALIKSRGKVKLRPSLSELIEIAQVTDSLFGVGLAFGAAVGQIGDAAFAATGAGKGAGGGLRTPRFVARYGELFADLGASMNRTELRFARAAAGVMMWAPLFVDPAAPFVFEERVEALVALWPACELLRPLFEHPALADALDLVDAESYTPPAYARVSTAAALALGGIAVRDGSAWPIAGAPRELTALDHFRTMSERAGLGLRVHIAAHEDEALGVVFATMAARLTDRLMILLTGGRDTVSDELTPPWALLEGMALANRVINAGQLEAGNRAFIAAAMARIETGPTKLLGAPELDAIAAASGVQLLKLLPPDARPEALKGLTGLDRP